MKMFVLIAVFVLSASTSVVAETGEKYAEVDRYMIRQLALDPGQAFAYQEIIQRQRELFLGLQPNKWQQELALYHETFALLKPVLTLEQHAAFVGIINSFIEQAEGEYFLVMEN